MLDDQELASEFEAGRIRPTLTITPEVLTPEQRAWRAPAESFACLNCNGPTYHAYFRGGARSDWHDHAAMMPTWGRYRWCPDCERLFSEDRNHEGVLRPGTGGEWPGAMRDDNVRPGCEVCGDMLITYGEMRERIGRTGVGDNAETRALACPNWQYGDRADDRPRHRQESANRSLWVNHRGETYIG